MKSIIKKIKSKTGMALPSVIIICSILLMMLIPLLNLSVQQLKVSKSQLNIGNSYLATGTATEKAVKGIRNYINQGLYKPPYKNYYDPNGDQYVTNMINDIGPGSLWEAMENAIGTQTDVGSSSKAKSRLIKLIKVGTVAENSSHDKFVVTLGFIITSSLQKGINTSSGTDIYSEVVFEIDKKKSSFKPAAINGIGDLYITGDSAGNKMNAVVNGDIKIVGTAPEKATQPQQDRYGGIYATQNGNLIVNGNAFVRAFIRCGDTSDASYNDYMVDPITSLGDNSKIEIRKNAVAQCLQIFGHNDSILVHNDAFTFDDIEMNGLNSIIAINRSFFGLSNTNGSSNEYHDASSAIVNSSVVHYPDEKSIGEAKRSKIVINGNVMINGGTFWINPDTGKPLYPKPTPNPSNPTNPPDLGEPQIEDASNAWNDDDDLPTYKNFEYPLNKPFHLNLSNGYSDDDTEYRQETWLYKQFTSGLAKGYSNFIQCWTPKDTISDVINWFNGIKGGNSDYQDFKDGTLSSKMPFGFQIPATDYIKGFCHYEIAANGTMYFMDKKIRTRSSTDRPKKYIEEADFTLLNTKTKVELEKSWYYLGDSGNDKQFGPSNTDFSTWWTSNWTYSDYEGYLMGVENYMDVIKPKLQKITEDFVTRNYQYATGDIVNGYVQEANSTTYLFNSIGQKLKGCDNGSLTTPDEVIIDSEIIANCPKFNDAYQISDYIRSLDTTPLKTTYFIVAIDNPDITVEINSEINAIVYTRGKIIMTDKGKINGFILAAGKGYNGGATTVGSAADLMPYIKSDGTNIGLLDSGEFASVIFKGAGNATVNFNLNTTNIDMNSDGKVDQEDNLLVLLGKYTGTIYSTLSELFK